MWPVQLVRKFKPINPYAYYDAARFKKVRFTGPEDPRAAQVIEHSHGMVAWDQEHYIVEQVKEPVSGHPSSHFITSGNGGGSFSVTMVL